MGFYGVALGGAFFAESMFTRASDASKVALVSLGAPTPNVGIPPHGLPAIFIHMFTAFRRRNHPPPRLSRSPRQSIDASRSTWAMGIDPS